MQIKIFQNISQYISQNTCLCLRTENRSRKRHVFEYRDCGVGWGGVGGHVNVPCTSYMIYCHAAEISGIVYYVTCSMWNLMKKSVPSSLSAKSDLLMVYTRAWQWRCIHKNADCQLITVHALQRWRWKAKKRAPSFSRISNHQISTALW